MRRFLAFISVFLLCTFFSPVVYAEEAAAGSVPISADEEVMPCAEQTEWYFRINISKLAPYHC